MQFEVNFKFRIKGKTESDNRVRKDFTTNSENFFLIQFGRGTPKLISWAELFNPADRYITNGVIILTCEARICESDLIIIECNIFLYLILAQTKTFKVS